MFSRSLEGIWEFPKIMGKPPNHQFVHRVFHYFNHPFWGPHMSWVYHRVSTNDAFAVCKSFRIHERTIGIFGEWKVCSIASHYVRFL